ncbi:hypothetical protein [Flavobacterium sp. T12S277]|uniref:hypothetical protein n=1 Tax=Flavobacterium sp. T12S277 TaxID=3402752 RepID=UPI003ADF8A67
MKLKIIELIARIGVFGTFIGHGITAFNINPKWIPLLSSAGFSEKEAILLMPFIGIMDIIVAFLSLFYPVRIVLLWAITWAFLTALSRPFSGESIVELIERSANWCLPLTLLIIQGVPGNYVAIFKIRG